MLFQFLLDILNVTSDGTWNIDSFPVFDLKFSFLPVSRDIFIQLLLKLHLLVSRVGDIFNILLEIEKRSS